MTIHNSFVIPLVDAIEAMKKNGQTPPYHLCLSEDGLDTLKHEAKILDEYYSRVEIREPQFVLSSNVIKSKEDEEWLEAEKEFQESMKREREDDDRRGTEDSRV